MKTMHLFTLAGVLCAGLLTANAADKKDLAGPKGGRLLEKTEPIAEFFLEKDHTATVRFYDAKRKEVPAATQQVTVIADVKDGKARIEFERKGDILVSKSKLPAGDGYNVIVQVKQTTDAKPQNFRFVLDTHTCGGCKHAEYACSCHE